MKVADSKAATCARAHGWQYCSELQRSIPHRFGFDAQIGGITLISGPGTSIAGRQRRHHRLRPDFCPPDHSVAHVRPGGCRRYPAGADQQGVFRILCFSNSNIELRRRPGGVTTNVPSRSTLHRRPGILSLRCLRTVVRFRCSLGLARGFQVAASLPVFLTTGIVD